MSDNAPRRARVREILARAYATLQTAEYGYDDLRGKDRKRRYSGLRNVITFGRSVTFVLQNLRSACDDFDEWYGPKVEEMKTDPLMVYFIKARNEVEKQGKLSISTEIRNVYVKDESSFGPAPPNAFSFFIGDALGGSGWNVRLPDGSVLQYYVELPKDVAEVAQYFSDIDKARAPDLANKSIEELCEQYLKRLRALLDEARERFDSQPPPTERHLRVVR